MSGVLRCVVAALTLLALAACADRPPIRVLDETAPRAAERERPTAARPADRAAVHPVRPERPAPEKTALPPPTAEQIARAPDPMALAGQDAAAVRTVLGPAPFLRREPPVQVWQYRGATCVLDLVLYPAKGGGGGLTVEHVEMRPVAPSDRRLSPKACAADVVRLARPGTA